MFSSNTSQVSSGGYEIQRSLRFNSADSAYLNRTPASASNRRTFTFSAWVKRSALGTDQDFFGVRIDGDNQFRFYCNTSNKIDIYNQTVGSLNARLITTQVFRDVSAWYHFVVAIDTTNATAGDRMRLYVNNVEVTAFDTDTQPTQNLDTQVDTVNSHTIGYFGVATGNNYMTEVNFIDGQQLTPSSFGAFDAQTGVWGPTPYAGSYGTNGFYLNFSDNSNTTAATLGKDYSGNGNNWTPNNFSVSAGAGNDSLVDVPTNWGTDTGVGGTVRGNYSTLNPLNLGANTTSSNGNLDMAVSGSGYGTAKSTIGVSSGKWYVEARLNTAGYHMAGISSSSAALSNALGSTADSYSYFSNSGQKYNNGTLTSYGATFTSGDIISIVLDMDAGTLTFYKNGTTQGTAFTGLTGTFFFGVTGDGSGAGSWTLNFGQRPFAYTAPSGFKALNTQNLPTPTIGATTATQAGKFFNPVTYTGNGTTQSIAGVGFQPDFVWVKSRSSTTNHVLIDVLRGVSRWLGSNDTSAEFNSPGDFVTAFNSDGFSVGPLGGVNSGSTTYVGWNWKANGAGVTNTAGSITSTVSANTTSGFSVVTYTGTGANATVGHGIGSAPKMVIYKARNTTGGWFTYHTSVGPTKELELNTTSGEYAIDLWQNTNPSSTVFYLSNNVYVNNSGTTYVAYCFAEVPGYSRFGSYFGNSSSDGPFVFCGFRPAYVMVKLSSSGGTADWIVEDGTRNPYNVVNAKLSPNTSGAEFVDASAIGIDFLSNGFKIRGTDGAINTANTYIFAAFASAPQKFALAR